MNQKNAEELLILTESISKIGYWELDLKTNDLFWSPGVFKICGYQPNEFEITFENAMAVIHPDDRDLAMTTMNEAIASGTPYEIRKRFITKDQKIIQILSKGIITYNQDGIASKLFGIFQDISSVVALEESYKNANANLQDRNQFIETIIANLPIGIAVNKISTGEATVVNKSFSAIYGWADNDFADIATFFKKVYPDESYRKRITAQIITDIESGDLNRMSWQNIEITTSKNEKRVINAKNIPVYEQDLMISTVTDVTVEINLFEQLKNQKADLRALIENTEDVIYAVDMDFKLITFNSTFSRIVKIITNQNIEVGNNIFDFYPDAKKEHYLSIYTKVKKGNKYIFEDAFNFPDHLRYYEVLVNPIINSDGKQRGFSVFSKDITSKKIIEVEKEKAILQFNRIMDSSMDVICTIDENGCFLKVSSATTRLWGYHPQELSGKLCLDLVHPDDREMTRKIGVEIMQGMDVSDFENRYIRKNGSIIPVVWSVKWDVSDKTMYAVARDVTERKKNEKKLQLSEQYFKGLVQEGSDLIAILDIEGNYIYVSPTSSNILGIAPDFFIGKNAISFIHPNDQAGITESFRGLSQQKRIKLSPFRFKGSDENWRWIETIVTNLLDDPATNGIVANSRDVTERIENEKKLNHTNQLLKSAQRITRIGNWEYHFNSQQITCSEEIFSMLETGYDEEGKFSLVDFLQFVHPDDLDEFLINLQQAEQNAASLSFQHRVITKTNKIKYLNQLGERIFDEENKSYWLFGTTQDITEQRIIEEKIKESELKYRSFFQNSMDGILLTVTNGDILAANPAACEIFQMTEEEIIKKSRYGLVDIDDPRVYELINKRQQEGKTRGELTLVRKDGSKFQGELTSVMFLDTYGRELTSMIVRDITKQKEFEIAIQESNQRFEYVTKATSDAIWDWDFAAKTIYWGPGFYQLFGFEENITRSNTNLWSDRIHPDDKERVESGLSQLIESDLSHWFDEYRFKNQSGNYAYVSDQGFLIRNEVGKAIRMVGAMSDVTQKKVEEERLKLLESVIINAYDAVMVTEADHLELPDSKIVYVNEAFAQMTGYNAEEVIGKTPRILQGPLTDKNESRKLSNALKQFEPHEVTTINYKKNGEPFWVNFTVTPLANDKGVHTHFICIERDVTNEKLAEEKIKNALAEKDSILESIGDGFFAVNKDWIVTYWNKNAEMLLLMPKEEILGKKLWVIFNKKIHSKSYVEYGRALKTHTKVQFEDYYEPIGKWYEVSVYPGKNGLSIYFKDISERVNHTKAIEQQNKQLQEIAYTQSHIVRAPLARILGIVSLMQELNQEASSEKDELLKYLFTSASELDDVIRSIVKKTEHIDI